MRVSKIIMLFAVITTSLALSACSGKEAKNTFAQSTGDDDASSTEAKSTPAPKQTTSSSKADVMWRKSFGSNMNDWVYDTIATSDDAFVAVGSVALNQAYIRKYDSAGEVLWAHYFNGSDSGATFNHYNSAVEVSDGFIAVGYMGNGGSFVPLVAKYDSDGELVWHMGFGSGQFRSVTPVEGGFIAVGYCDSFGSGVWEGYDGYGFDDAIIVKFTDDGEVVWQDVFGDSSGYGNAFYSIVAVSDGVITVGGNDVPVAVKYDNDGNIEWKGYSSNFGAFLSVVEVADGVVAAGSLGSSYLQNIGKGDALLVKYDWDGKNIWETTTKGSNENNIFYSVSPVSDGVIAVGVSGSNSIIVKCDNKGKIVWEDSSIGILRGTAPLSDGVIVAGYASTLMIDNTPVWQDFKGNGADDGIIIKYKK